MIATIESIYRQHRKGMFTLALSITGHPDTAEDAVHEAVVRLCRVNRIPTRDVVAYVFAAVRNAAIDQKRRPGRAVSIFDLPERSQTADSSLYDAERDQMVASAIAELPDDQREAVVMHLYTGLTFEQSAQALHVPLQTVASRYRRALAKLREQLTSLR